MPELVHRGTPRCGDDGCRGRLALTARQCEERYERSDGCFWRERGTVREGKWRRGQDADGVGVCSFSSASAFFVPFAKPKAKTTENAY